MGRTIKLTQNDLIDTHILVVEYGYTVKYIAKNIMNVSQSTLSTRYKYFKYELELGDIPGIDEKLDTSRKKLKRLGFEIQVRDKLN